MYQTSSHSQIPFNNSSAAALHPTTDILGWGLIHLGRWFLFLACCRWAVADVTKPETVEVDLVFPRNDTYAPVGLMPLVFAIQNFPASRSLFAHIDIAIWYTPSWNNTIQNDIIYLDRANYTNASNLHFAWSTTSRFNNTEGTWALKWSVYSSNCTDTGRGPKPLGPGLCVQTKVVQFSTRYGAQQPDLVAATKDGICGNTTAVTFNITQVKAVPELNRYSGGHDICPILAPVAPAPEPCLAKINATTASSIMYDIQSRACMGGLNANVTCPPKPDDENAAMQILPFSLWWQSWWLVIALAGLANVV